MFFGTRFLESFKIIGGGDLGPPSVRHCNLVDIIRLVASLFQQVRHIDDITILLQLVSSTLLHFCYIMTVSNLLEQPCNKSDNAIKLRFKYKLLTACSKLVTTTGNKQYEHNLSTACEQICNNLFADL